MADNSLHEDIARLLREEPLRDHKIDVKLVFEALSEYRRDVARLRADVERLERERDELKSDLHDYMDAAASEADEVDRLNVELTAARAEGERLRGMLKWLDQRGGLGHDVHDRIRAALNTGEKEN